MPSEPRPIGSHSRKLLQQGQDTKTDLAGKFVLYREAHDVAAAAGDAQLAASAIDEMGKTFTINAPEMKAEVLRKKFVAAPSPTVGRTLAEAYLAMCDEQIAAGDYDAATRSAALAEAPARATKDIAFITSVQNRGPEVHRIQQEAQQVKAAQEKLAKTPNDPDANLAVGKFLCFSKGDWDTGLPMLAKGSDATLAELAKAELAIPAESADQKKLADGWWGVAEKQGEMQKKQAEARASFWYQHALAGLSGLEKTLAEKRIAAAGAVAVKTTAGKGWTDLLAKADMKGPRAMDWQLADGVLVKKGPMHATLSFPVTVKGDYELQLTLNRQQGTKEMILTFPVGSREGQLWFGGMDGQDSSLAGTRAHTTEKVIVNNQDMVLNIKVATQETDKTGTIDITLNDKPYMKWSGPLSELHLMGRGPADEGTFSLAVHSATKMTFKTMRSARGRPAGPLKPHLHLPHGN